MLRLLNYMKIFHSSVACQGTQQVDFFLPGSLEDGGI